MVQKLVSIDLLRHGTSPSKASCPCPQIILSREEMEEVKMQMEFSIIEPAILEQKIAFIATSDAI